LSGSYSLKTYYESAGLPAIPKWAEEVTMPFKPFEHQIGDLNHLAQFTRSGLWSEPGVGKTLSMQAYGIWLVGQKNRVIYIMPPVLTGQFMNSFLSTYQGIDKKISITKLEGTPKKREEMFNNWSKSKYPDILVMSYRMFVQYQDLLKTKRYNCVVVDEATIVKSPSSQIHKAVKQFAGNVDKDSNGVVLVTGTPVETNVTDAYGLIAILNPKRYGSKKAFDRIHCDYAPPCVTKFPLITGYKNLDYLHIGLMALGRRIKKVDVLDLPPRIIQEIPVILKPKHKRLYDKLIDERLAELPDDKVIDLTAQAGIYQAMQRVLMNPEVYTGDKIENQLVDTFDELVSSLSGYKVLVYAWFQGSIEKIKEKYKHLNPATLYGKTQATQRNKQRLEFINNPDCKMMIANPKSGGVGVDGLQTVCSHVIFAEVCPYPGVFQQSIDRLHRSGQGSTVNVYVLVPENTIAVKLRNDLVKKDELQEKVVLDKRTMLSDLKGEGGVNGTLD